MKKLIITEKSNVLNVDIPDVEIISPEEYIGLDQEKADQRMQVINLCKNYSYQSEGYYISLLAEARGHKVIPVTSTMMDLRLQNLAREDAQDFQVLIDDTLEKANAAERSEFTIFFGMCQDMVYHKVADLLFNLFQIPVLRVVFIKKDKWLLHSLKPLGIKELNGEEKAFLEQSLKMFLTSKNVVRKNYQRKKYDLAILVNPNEKTAPSDAGALQQFVKAANKIGFNTEIITKSDYARLTQFDALLIRETTNVNHHTFRFARKAEYEGIAVLDDPQSILRCTNKVYLKELLEFNEVPIPKSEILQKGYDIDQMKDFNFPYVLKKPDSSFSQGVKKVNNIDELKLCLKDFFSETEIVIAQEFMPTDFDWRIGVLNGEILYVCKYYMARNHWQIVQWKESGATRYGRTEAIATDKAPKKLLSTALKAANLIGNGLYGVDMKEVNGKFFVIEVNDNPSIDHGVEDQLAKGKLYQQIINHLMKTVQTV